MGLLNAYAKGWGARLPRYLNKGPAHGVDSCVVRVGRKKHPIGLLEMFRFQGKVAGNPRGNPFFSPATEEGHAPGLGLAYSCGELDCWLSHPSRVVGGGTGRSAPCPAAVAMNA